jgi:catechol 2,3-dioxygenase-like lactoylglutathione lyase family enzyme
MKGNGWFGEAAGFGARMPATPSKQASQNNGSDSMSVGLLDHFNIRTAKLGETVRFYEEVLDLTKGDRPNFAFPGAWMYSEGKPVVHLVDIAQTSEQQKPDSGVVHHVAFASRGFAGMKHRLASKGLPFDVREVPGVEVWQIFVTDPNGVMIELNYEMSKEDQK